MPKKRKSAHGVTDAADRLYEREERFRQIFENSHEAMMEMTPPSWCFVDANRAALRLFGVASKAQFLQLTPWVLSPERQPDGGLSSEKAREMIENALDFGSHFFEWQHQRLNGESFPAEVRLTRIRVNEQVWLHATVRDNSKRQQTKQTLLEHASFLGTLLDTVPIPLFYKDTAGRYLGINQGFAVLTGRARNELIGKSVFDIAPHELAEIYHAKDCALFLNPGAQEYETKLQDAQGVMHEVRYHNATFRHADGRVAGLDHRSGQNPVTE